MGGLLLAEPAWGQVAASPSGAAVAPSTPTLSLVVSGECPGRAALATELGPLLHRWRLQEGMASGSASTTAVVTDEGARIRVEVLDTVRHVDETRRDCGERARIGAVLIAMALEPPLVAGGNIDSGPSSPKHAALRETDTTDHSPTAPNAAAAEASRPSDAHEAGDSSAADLGQGGSGALIDFAVELSAMVSFGLGPDPVGPGVGPFVAVRGIRGPWAAYYAAAFVPAQELDLDEGRAHMTRIPMDVGVGYVMEQGGWTLEPALGIALDPFFLEGDDLSGASRELRLDVGPRATLQASLGSHWVRGLASLRAAWFPRTYELIVNPAGTVGNTPGFWLEMTLGARFGLN